MGRILIVGGGYVGVYTALGLARRLRSHAITIVSPENFMQYQPFLPEVAGGTIDPRAVVVPLRSILRRAQLVVGEVERIDHAARAAFVRLLGGERLRKLRYDHVVVATGSRSRVPPIPGLSERAIGFKTVAEAIWLRNHVLAQLDRADQLQDLLERRTALTFVFVGAGYAGVEALGEAEDLARSAVRAVPGLSRADMRWILVEAAPRILPELGRGLASYAHKRLRERGIEVLTNTQLVSAKEYPWIELGDRRRIPTETLVWTAGVRPSGLAKSSGLPVDGAGRVLVDAALRVRGLEGVWAAGDAAAVPDLASGPQALSPPTAQHAIRQARRLASNIAASLDGRPVRPYLYRSLGGLCSLGHFKGVADPLGFKIKGFPAWFLHRSYHLLYMPTLGRKVRIALDWTVALLFPRDIAALGSLERPREAFRRASTDADV